MGTVEELRKRAFEKAEEIRAAIAISLGYDLNNLSKAQSADLEDELDRAIEEWETTAEMEIEPPTPKTPLQMLLAQHHELCEQIMDVEDDAAGSS